MKTDVSSNRYIQVERQGHLAVVTINNPPANTWTIDSLNELTESIDSLGREPSVTALVITGSGDKFFSAGADLNQFAEGDKESGQVVAEAFGRAFECLAQFPGLSIAAINGYAMGGGLECALACDIRIAEQQAKMALPEARVGLLPCAGGTQRLAWLVGEAWAARMILCGETVTSERALEIGLVQESVASGESKKSAVTLAQSVASQSPDAIKACKALLTKAREKAISEGLKQERSDFIDLLGRPNQLEGTRAFLEKREPNWE